MSEPRQAPGHPKRDNRAMRDYEINDRYLLALAAFREARGEPFAAKLLVCQTIMERVNDPRWPPTVAAVLTDPDQFSSFSPDDPNFTKFPERGPEWKAWLSCYEAAGVAWREASLHGRFGGGPTHFYSASTPTPDWAKSFQFIAEVGEQVFLRQ